jgi:hypothetical protein
MPYSNKNENVKNINYTNKEFNSLKSSLMDYAKAYFPTTYQDFNESSPGMMLIEMSAYVGDVLSFYIDQQYKEMMLPLAQERRNVINLAKTLGYKVKATKPAFCDITFKQDIGYVVGDDNSRYPNYTQAKYYDEGIIVKSSADTNITFETLDRLDFTYSGSEYHLLEETGTDSNGLVDTYTLTRKIKAISGTRKTKNFIVGSPSKFLELDISDKNVVEIISVMDSGNRKWYEVDYLAQDKVRVETDYTADGRGNAYRLYDSSIQSVPIPFTLEYKKVSRRFIVQTNEDNTTTLVFGNGILRNGQELGQEFLDLKQVGLTIPGETSNYDFTGDSYDFALGDVKSTMGEMPFNTTLTVTYRVSNGLSENVGAGNLVNIVNASLSDATDVNLRASNNIASSGGSSADTVDEIRNKALGMFTTQNRCVTKEDYESRLLSMPAKFGNLAKVFVNRGQEIAIDNTSDTTEPLNDPKINVYILSYNSSKSLTITLNQTDGTLHPLKQNVINFLENYKMLADDINITNGYVINFGVVFDVVAERGYNKQEVKFNCIRTIKEYFNIENRQFRQPIYTNNLIYELQGMSGVRSVNYIELTQDFVLNSGDGIGYGITPLYCNDTDFPEYGACNPDAAGSTYGWKYDFKQFYGSPYNGTILPSVTPSVFELKNPNKNIIGVVN